MQPNFTLNHFRAYCLKIMVATVILITVSNSSRAQVLYSEDFATVVPLPAGWASQNLSSPVGSTGWFQGNAAVFPAQSGATTSYIGANFNNTTGDNTISNWLFMPNVTLKNGDIFTFWTRVPTGGAAFPDRLQVRMSTNGASVNAGATSTSVGDFTTLLLDINPTYTAAYPEVWTQYTITISGLGAPTSGRLAFRYFVESGGPAGLNSNYIGIDNVVYTTFAAPCSGTPAPGNTLSTANPVCPGINFTLSINPISASGLTYQWQSSPDGVAWTNIPGATNANLVRNQTSATWYRVNVTCSGNTGASTPLQVLMNAPTNCYCTPTYSSGCALGDAITRVRLLTLDNASTCAPAPYFTYFSAVAAPTVFKGATHPLTVSFGADPAQYFAAWIDFNVDGDFDDAGEFLGATTTSAGANGSSTLNIAIPAGAPSGVTRMRIRGGNDSPLTGTQSCGASSSGFGETEDYNVNVQPCVQGVFTTQPANTSISCSGNATFTVAATGSALSYTWQERTSAAAPWTNVSNGGVYSGATTASLTLTNVPATMNGYQYRALMTGACTAIDFSNVATLTVTPLVATVSPASATICNGAIQQLTLTNASSPATAVFNATGLPVTVPDASTTGVFSTNTVSGLPAGAVVSNISITFTMTHTWVGDLVMNLRAPNGQVLNLVGALNGGTGSNGTANFTNTTISNTGTTPLSGAPPPRTGTFAADAFTATIPTIAPTTTNTWGPLLTTLNGNWQLAMCDIGAGDIGVLTSWSISITYGAAATGVWTSSPAAPNTMFTDAAATVPYVAGSQATSIYVKPAATTSYSVVYSTATPCTSNPTTIPVTVIQPITAAAASPAAPAVCVGGGTTFSVTGLAGGPVSAYQWQLSTDNGATWNNISGATSSTYSVSNATSAMSGNRYRAVLSAAPCAGTFNSASATLTVNPLPVVTLAATDLNLTPGQTSVITASSTPAANTYSWQLNGSTITGVSGNNYTANIDRLGTYTVTATTAAGCASSAAATITIGAEASDKLWIYPNPTDGVFQVRLYYAGPVSEKRMVSVFNTSGQLVAQKEFSLEMQLNASGSPVSLTPYLRMDFDFSNKPAGAYLVKCHNQFNDQITSGWVIVQ